VAQKKNESLQFFGIVITTVGIPRIVTVASEAQSLRPGRFLVGRMDYFSSIQAFHRLEKICEAALV
jgi:hypothetical protein